MKMGKPRPKLFIQNENNDYSERKHSQNSMTACEKCCCNSCTGFRCPWKSKAPIGTAYNVNEPHKYPRSAVRCGICHIRFNYERLYDCDYYTYYRRKKFFRIRKVKNKEKLDTIIEMLEKLLDK